MKRIYKYPIPITDEFTLELPIGAEILTFQTQHNKPHIWALIDPEREFETVGFRLFGTGHPVEDADTLKYIGTTQTEGGLLVWHLFKSYKIQ
jgi:hypothetical protein